MSEFAAGWGMSLICVAAVVASVLHAREVWTYGVSVGSWPLGTQWRKLPREFGSEAWERWYHEPRQAYVRGNVALGATMWCLIAFTGAIFSLGTWLA